MSDTRLKEIKRLKYEKAELIRKTKKEIKKLQEEEDAIYGAKRLVKKRGTDGKTYIRKR